MSDLLQKLSSFSKTNRVNTKGPLSVMLVITRRAIDFGLPLDPETLLSPRKGQVAGLSESAVQKVLKQYGITRVLSKEAGRTSRGSIDLMRNYVSLLNKLNEDGLAELNTIEKWWVSKVKEFFARSPFKLKLDHSKSFRAIVRDLMAQTLARQKEMPGTMFSGAVLQHLVGAKLELVLPEGVIEHNGFSVADGPTRREGDFQIDDVVVHVTTAPTEMLIRQCTKNLSSGYRPIIVTTYQGAGGAEALASNAGIDGRIDIFEIEQFIATNVYELSKFLQADRRLTVEQLVEKYNSIVAACETDPSLRIELG